MNYKYVNIDEIFERVFRDFPLSENEFQWTDGVAWVGELLKLIDVPILQERKNCIIPIIGYKGELPSDLFQVHTFMNKENNQMMKYSGDPYFRHLHCDDSPSISCDCFDTKLQYQLSNNYIYTAFEEGELEISYYAIPVDDRGYPMIPDKEAVKLALYWEIASKLAFKMWVNSKLDGDKFKYITQQRDWYVGKAINTPKIPDIGKMEAIKNFTLRLIPKINILDDRFRFHQEKKYNHNTNNFNQGTQF